MRVLVTGAAGQVGGDLRTLLTGLPDVVFADRHRMDFASEASISAGLDDIRPDVVVNAAAYTAVDAAEDNESVAFAVNAKAPGQIARWLARRGGFLVHFSTDYVYDGKKASPYFETDSTGPLSAYGRSKLAGEEEVRESNVEHLIFRISWVYTHHGRNFFLTMLRLFMEREVIRVVSDQSGAPTCSYDVAQFVATRVLPRLDAGTGTRKSRPPTGVYHLASGGWTSWHGFACAIRDGCEQIPTLAQRLRVESIDAIRTDDYPTRAIRPRNSRLDCSKIVDVFGGGLANWTEQLNSCLTRYAAS